MSRRCLSRVEEAVRVEEGVVVELLLLECDQSAALSVPRKLACAVPPCWSEALGVCVCVCGGTWRVWDAHSERECQWATVTRMASS